MVIMWLRIYCPRYSFFFMLLFRKASGGKRDEENRKVVKLVERVIYVFVIHFCVLHVN